MTIFQFHEFANIFPLLVKEELNELCADIEKNGLTEPITFYEGKVLDGRNRASACHKLGIEPETIEYTGDDPLAFVLSKNLHRRHLTTSQRAMVAEKLANLSEGRPELTAQNCAVNQSEAAKQFNVSRRSVQEARKIRTKAVPEVAEAVEAGKLPVSVAAKLADVPPEQQREIVAKKDKKAIIAEVREKKQQKCKSGAAASRRKTIAKEPEPDFAERYRQWLDDPNEKETPVPEQNEEGILKLAMPLDHRAMSAVFMKTFRKESEEVRDRIIAEVTQLAYAIGNLND